MTPIEDNLPITDHYIERFNKSTQLFNDNPYFTGCARDLICAMFCRRMQCFALVQSCLPRGSKGQIFPCDRLRVCAFAAASIRVGYK